jgi:hypothetical protein
MINKFDDSSKKKMKKKMKVKMKVKADRTRVIANLLNGLVRILQNCD